MATQILSLAFIASAPGSSLRAAESPPPFSLHDFLDAPDGLKLSGSIRVRQETLDGQFRPGFDAYDDLLSVRTMLFAEWKHGNFRLGGELYDSRAYDTDDRSVLTTTEVNALEPVQAYVAYDFRNPFGAGSAATVQAGRFVMNVGSRRLVAADDYRNTTNGYTGVRVDLTRADKSSLLLYYTLPQYRLPDDFQSLRDNDVQLDDESFDVQLWGFLATRAGLPGKLSADIGYVRFDEGDLPDRPSRNRDLHSITGRVIRDAAPGKWDGEVEGIYQSGRIRASLASTAAMQDVTARFLHVELGHSFTTAWRPRASVEYDYASGDEPGPGYNRFDTLFGMRRAELGPSGIYSAIGRTNLESVALRVETTPSPRLDAFASYRALWAASATDFFSTTGLRDITGATGSFAGHQIETRIRYWLVPQTLRAEFNGVVLLKEGLTRDAPNAPGHGNTVYLSGALTVSF